MACRQIFLVAGLFADQHHLGMSRPFAEHEMRGLPIEVATGAPFGNAAHLLKVVTGLAVRFQRWSLLSVLHGVLRAQTPVRGQWFPIDDPQRCAVPAIGTFVEIMR